MSSWKVCWLIKSALFYAVRWVRTAALGAVPHHMHHRSYLSYLTIGDSVEVRKYNCIYAWKLRHPDLKKEAFIGSKLTLVGSNIVESTLPQISLLTAPNNCSLILRCVICCLLLGVAGGHAA